MRVSGHNKTIVDMIKCVIIEIQMKVIGESRSSGVQLEVFATHNRVQWEVFW